MKCTMKKTQHSGLKAVFGDCDPTWRTFGPLFCPVVSETTPVSSPVSPETAAGGTESQPGRTDGAGGLSTGWSCVAFVYFTGEIPRKLAHLVAQQLKLLS